jgi:hypothetical protein
MLTSTGRMFFPLDPRADDVRIEDIAAGLSRQCRYGGQLRDDVDFYSTAEHCVALARHFLSQGEKELAKWALLHDAAEAYLNELIRPIKPAVPQYRDLESRLMWEICGRFGLPFEAPQEVKEADRRILLDERLQVMPESPLPWTTDGEPLGAIILCYSPRMARAAFLHYFGELFGDMA